MGRRLERHLDEDLIARMARGWKASNHVEPAKHVKPRRKADTYRAARRNKAFER